jgi:glutathione S-transferase
LEVLKAETMPFFLKKLDEIAGENDGYFALKKLTWADLYFVGLLKYLNHMAGFDITENYANLKKVVANAESAPGIKEWIEKRPESNM